jgi:hypothetical protein
VRLKVRLSKLTNWAAANGEVSGRSVFGFGLPFCSSPCWRPKFYAAIADRSAMLPINSQLDALGDLYETKYILRSYRKITSPYNQSWRVVQSYRSACDFKVS